MSSARDRFDPVALAQRHPFWSAHDAPDRLFNEHVLLCSCVDCRAAIAAEARRRPRRALGLKTGFDRILVTAEYLAEVLAAATTLESLLYVAGDYVREVFVPVDGYLLPPQRWWSLSCHEDEEAEGRPHRQRRVATRQSARSRRRVVSALRDEADARPAPPPFQPVPLREAVAPARIQHRELVTAAAAWALAAGVSLPADMVAYLCGAATNAISLGDQPVEWWSRERVVHLLTCDLTNWCSLHRCLRPEGAPEALWRFLQFLADTGRLDPGSDPLAELRKPLLCYGGLDFEGNRNLTGERLIDCECYRTYRGPTHGELDAP